MENKKLAIRGCSELKEYFQYNGVKNLSGDNRYCGYFETSNGWDCFTDYFQNDDKYEVVSFTEYFKRKKTDNLPPKWKIKNCKEVGEFYDEKCRSKCYSDLDKYEYLPSHNQDDEYILESYRPSPTFSYGDFNVPEITIEQFRKHVLKLNNTQQEIKEQNIMKNLSVTKTQTVQIGKKKREITITVLSDLGKVRAGYSVRNPEDKKSNPELAKQISTGRAMSDKTNLVDMNLGRNMDKKYILYAIAEQLFREIESGKIQIKGVK